MMTFTPFMEQGGQHGTRNPHLKQASSQNEGRGRSRSLCPLHKGCCFRSALVSGFTFTCGAMALNSITV
jgi:hypothetical protein